ncbi:MAG: universal stress protein [Anaerolineales bacterium]|nr:universal stress protein [Anaerolineales bacterium]
MDRSSKPQNNSYALICIGDRPLDHQALSFAESISRALMLDPVLLHVSPPEADPQHAEQLLAAACEALEWETVECRTAEGSAKIEILRELDSRPYQLLILGTSERESHLPVSPLSRDLAVRANTSVLLVRNPPEKIRQFLICTGGHTASFAPITWGIRLAQATDAHVTFLHVVSSAPAMYTGLPALDEGLSEVLARDHPLAHHLKKIANMAEAASVEANLEFRHGMVIEEILRSCEVETHDLVVIGAPQSRARIDTLLLGRIAPKLLASSNLSTVIVRDNHGEKK